MSKLEEDNYAFKASMKNAENQLSQILQAMQAKCAINILSNTKNNPKREGKEHDNVVYISLGKLANNRLRSKSSSSKIGDDELRDEKVQKVQDQGQEILGGPIEIEEESSPLSQYHLDVLREVDLRVDHSGSKKVDNTEYYIGEV